jgi:hypothetical protein
VSLDKIQLIGVKTESGAVPHARAAGSRRRHG